MSKMDVKSALERIAIAPKDSPLLVLTCGEKDNVQCYFSRTIFVSNKFS